MRSRILSLGLFSSVLGLLACGESSGTEGDAGITDAASMTDAGGQRIDAGEPIDAGSDAGQIPACTSGCNFVELGLGFQYSCARRENGQVRCWGRGMEGQLGDGNMTHRPRCPIGLADSRDCSSRPVTVAFEGPVTHLNAGGFSACAIDEAGAAQCWGEEGWDIAGEIPNIRYAPEAFPMLDSVRHVSDGSFFICAIDNEGAVHCGGQNFARQTGTGELPAFLPLPQPVKIAPEGDEPAQPLTGALEVVVAQGHSSFACARTASTVYCWGSDSSGQLGTGESYATCSVEGTHVNFDCTEYAHPITTLDGSMVTQLALGANHTCALLSDGTIQCWGDNRGGQLGTTDADERSTPALVPGITNAIQITAGSSQTCALLETGAVQCWGFNREGQLGDGLESHGSSCTLGSRNEGDCSATPVSVMGITDATHIEAGTQHVCAIRAEGTEVWCWGLNDMLQLGNGPNSAPSGAQLAPSRVPVMVIGL
jgi:alpha-tubulin suppressor-like RCC1 family protein